MNLPALGALLACFLAGHGLLRMLGFRATTGPERLGYAFAAGTAVLAAAAAALSPFAAANAWSLGGVLLLFAALPLLSHRPQATELRAEWPSFLPALALVLLSFWLAAQRPVWNVDAQMRWVLHGQWLADFGSLVPAHVADPSWASHHPGYPPLVPALVGFAVQLGADPDTGVRVLFPAFLLALLGILHGLGVRALGPLRGWLLPLAFGFTPAVLWQPFRGLAFGLGADAAVADIPLAAMLTAFSVLLLDAFRRGERAQVGAMAVFVAGAAWTKQEGAAFLVAMILATASCSLVVARADARRRALRALGLLLAAAVGAAALWKAVAHAMPVAPGEDYLSLEGLAGLFHGFDRLESILSRVGAEFLDLRTWGPLWLVALLAALVLLRRRDGVGLLPALWLLLGVGVAVAGFLASGWKEDHELLMEVSLARLLLHHAPLAAVLVAELGRRTLAPPPTAS